MKRLITAPVVLEGHSLDWSRPYVMGILNLTPDSFSDGGQVSTVTEAVNKAKAMGEAGATIIDLGGESTRPGASPVTSEQECARVLPVIQALAESGLLLSIDTTKAVVAQAAVAAGAHIVNDVSGGLFDPQMLPTMEALESIYICGHVRGTSIAKVHASTPASFKEVTTELGQRLALMSDALRARTWADPCIGFGKKVEVNLALVARAGELAIQLGCPVLIGPSRKRFLGELTNLAIGERDAATIGACLASVSSGAHMLRVHDVAMTAAAMKVYCAALEGAAA